MHKRKLHKRNNEKTLSLEFEKVSKNLRKTIQTELLEKITVTKSQLSSVVDVTAPSLSPSEPAPHITDGLDDYEKHDDNDKAQAATILTGMNKKSDTIEMDDLEKQSEFSNDILFYSDV